MDLVAAPDQVDVHRARDPHQPAQPKPEFLASRVVKCLGTLGFALARKVLVPAAESYGLAVEVAAQLDVELRPAHELLDDHVWGAAVKCLQVLAAVHDKGVAAAGAAPG